LPPGASNAEVLRRSLLALSALGAAGTALELVLLRHWTPALAVIPFVSLAVLGVAIVAVGIRPTRRRVLVGRLAAGLVAATAFVGVAVHVISNYDAGPLDFRYTASWPQMGEFERWLLAATDSVGPSPSLAPMALAFVALALFFATIGHPALTDRSVASAVRNPSDRIA
jgi:hypothetical protein